MASMRVRRKLIAVSVASAALTTTSGAAFAADSGAAKLPSTTSSGSTAAGSIAAPMPANDGTVKVPGKAPDISGLAKDLGVTVEQLDNALAATKQWVGTQNKLSEEAFAGHLASVLGLSADKVLTELKAHGLVIGAGPDGKHGQKPGQKPVGGKQGPGGNLSKAAKDLGVTVTQLGDAFAQTKQWIGTTGTKPTPKAFVAHLASILGKPEDKVLRVLVSDGLMKIGGGSDAKTKGGSGTGTGTGQKPSA